MRRKNSVMVIASLLATAAFSLSLNTRAAEEIRKAKISSESYFMKETIYADKEQPLGKLKVCVLLTDSARGLGIISVNVDISDSGQALTVEKPIKTLANGDISFEFSDDGWGNAGRGTFTKLGNRAHLHLEQTSWPPDADRNISRNYGSFDLMKAQCDAG